MSVKQVVNTDRTRVSNTCVSAFHLWLQGHTVPKEWGLAMQIAALPLAAPLSLPASQMVATVWGARLDKDIGGNDVCCALAPTQ